MQINPYTTYDVISLVEKLQKLLGDVAEQEIQLFSYLACLLSLYDGKTLTYWNYHFIKNDIGAPYSVQINEAIKLLNRNDMLISDDGYLQITDRGMINFNRLSELNLNADREKYLNASVNCLQYSPFSVVKESLFKEPILNDVIEISDRKNLLDEEDLSVELLYEQFTSLHKALEGKYSDHLVVPALTWLSLLGKNQIG
ncbi:hypothetical protein LX97_00653 [Nonlabens dokdonensis]|uniref:Uncharacterized protein n=2 Tax=Nonlabens dokdonensis TaxID=328515 RepID=L7W385_NONDD|nr:hypothetical protein [Nonlabens dokdonensis]AGC75975.1 hypothetical protein DDD_0848 [Nonlabens dokdonensis DSW-6]PZX43652.1 hypothetical protein LX97_00653 [Nonlabens dokdonensis]